MTAAEPSAQCRKDEQPRPTFWVNLLVSTESAPGFPEIYYRGGFAWSRVMLEVVVDSCGYGCTNRSLSSGTNTLVPGKSETPTFPTVKGIAPLPTNIWCLLL